MASENINMDSEITDTDLKTQDAELENIHEHDNFEQEESVELRERRIRKLSAKGQEIFEDNQRQFHLRMNVCHSDIKLLSRNIETYSNDLKGLEELKSEFIKSTTNYDKVCKTYLDYLARTNTQECIEEAQRVSSEIMGFTEKVEIDLKRLNDYVNQLRVTEREASIGTRSSTRGSLKTRSSKSNSTTCSSAVAKIKAKAEAAKVRAQFAEQETKMLKERALLEERKMIEAAKIERQKADLEAELDLLTCKKEAAAVEAEADALQSECDESMSQVLSEKPQMDPKLRTADLVSQIEQLKTTDQEEYITSLQKQPIANDMSAPFTTNINRLDPRATILYPRVRVFMCTRK